MEGHGSKASSAPTCQKHVGIFVFPFTSHPYSLLLLTRRLAAASPSTTTFSFFGTKKSNSALFHKPIDEDFPNIRPFDVYDGIPEGYVPTHDPKRVGVQLEHVGRFMRAAPESFRAAVAAAEAVVGCKMTCLVSAAFLWFMDELAVDLGVPWVAVQTCSPRHLVAAMNVNLIRSMMIGTDNADFKEKTIDFIPGFSTTRYGDLPDGIAWGNMNSPFAHMIHKMGQTLVKATALVINSFEEVDPVMVEYLRSKYQSCLHVGLSNLLPIDDPTTVISKLDEHGCLPWLEKQDPRSVVYVSFGTLASLPDGELVALAEALKEIKNPFLWSFKGNPGEKLREDLLDALKQQGKFVPWAPQVAILRHNAVGVFVMQCGWNSLNESIIGGVPVIARPLFGDQLLNRDVVEDVWGTGTVGGGGRFTKDGLVKDFKKILSGGGECMRERVAALKEAALKSMEPNGSSTRNFNALLDIVNE